jgi:organic hydroperoxide reductase OsmC/OhrA
MLWYLHLCAVHQVVVVSYQDQATGTMEENPDGSGQFKEIILYPVVIVTDEAMKDKAVALHREAHAMCFLARSVNFPIHHHPEIRIQ